MPWGKSIRNTEQWFLYTSLICSRPNTTKPWFSGPWCRSMQLVELSALAKALHPVSEGLKKRHKYTTRPLSLFLLFLPKMNRYTYFILTQIFGRLPYFTFPDKLCHCTMLLVLLAGFDFLKQFFFFNDAKMLPVYLLIYFTFL